MTKTATAEKPAIIADRVTKRPGPGPVFVPTGARCADRSGWNGVRHRRRHCRVRHRHAGDLPTELSPGADYIVTLINVLLIGEPRRSSTGCSAASTMRRAAMRWRAPAATIFRRSIRFSCWDVGFRPECPDPRGMTLVDRQVLVRHLSARHHLVQRWQQRLSGVTIADGGSPPGKVKGGSYASSISRPRSRSTRPLGKQLLGPEEFFAAAFGVTEGTSLEDDPEDHQARCAAHQQMGRDAGDRQHVDLGHRRRPGRSAPGLEIRRVLGQWRVRRLPVRGRRRLAGLLGRVVRCARPQ
jgi:hypothetical protein